jgi:hypothetical protein
MPHEFMVELLPKIGIALVDVVRSRLDLENAFAGRDLQVSFSYHGDD